MSSAEHWMLENCKNSVANEQNNIKIEEHRSEEWGTLPSHLVILFFPIFVCYFAVYFFTFICHIFLLLATNLLFIWCNGSITSEHHFFSLSTAIQNRVNLQIPLPSSDIFFLAVVSPVVSSDFCFYWICLSEKLLNTIMLSLSLSFPSNYELHAKLLFGTTFLNAASNPPKYM